MFELCLMLAVFATVYLSYLFLCSIIKNRKENKAKFIVNIISVCCMAIAFAFWIFDLSFAHMILAMLGVPTLFAGMLFFSNQLLAEKCRKSIIASISIAISHITYLLYHIFQTDINCISEPGLDYPVLWGRRITSEEKQIYESITSVSWRIFVLISIVVFVGAAIIKLRKRKKSEN